MTEKTVWMAVNDSEPFEQVVGVLSETEARTATGSFRDLGIYTAADLAAARMTEPGLRRP